MNWEQHIRHFKNYLKLERSLSENTIEAYERDVAKLAQFLEMKGKTVSPETLKSKHLQDFVEFLNELVGKSYFSSKLFYDFFHFFNKNSVVFMISTAMIGGIIFTMSF